MAKSTIVINSIALDPDDPFEAVLVDMVEMHREKSKHYGTDGNKFQNFYDIAYNLNIDPLLACEVLLNKHQAALKQWRIKGAQPTTYSDDAHLDRAVYAVIALVLYRRTHAALRDQ